MAGAELGGRLRSARIALVVGTRPEAIKLAPVADSLAARGLAPTLIVSGQHPRLDPAQFGLGGLDRLELGCAGREDPDAHAASVAAALRPILTHPHDLLVVQGDTSSAMGGALAGFEGDIPVAHVEAGLRTHDPNMPWPEEQYRTAIDARAELLFAPTQGSAANLLRENVPGDVHITGNTGIDALMRMLATMPKTKEPAAEAFRILVTCHRRENWGSGLNSLCDALSELAADGRISIDVVAPPNAHVAARMQSLIGDVTSIRLVPPFSHRKLIGRMRASDIILSDSGGMQEEAPALGVPLLVLREKTERPEGLASGNMLLVGTDRSRIVAAVRELVDNPVERAAMSRPVFPYGDGRTAPRIAAIIDNWLAKRGTRPYVARSTSPLR